MVIRIPTQGSNTYLIQGEKGYVLVDTGMDKSAKEIERTLTEKGISYDEIVLIILTHAHPDHMAALSVLQRKSGAPVLCHEYAASFIRRGESSPVIPRTGLGRFINRISPEWKIEETDVDFTFSKEIDLDPFGIPGKAVSTPGHTRGSLTVVLESGEILVGDQFRGKPGQLTLGMFYEDREVLLESLKEITAFHPSVIHMSHGNVTDGDDLEAFIGTLVAAE